MTYAEELAVFTCRATYNDLTEGARAQLKIRVLDSLGCALGALEGEPVQIVRRHIQEFDPRGACTLIGGGASSPESAALYNGALVRYLDFNDAYLARGEACHPSDNLPAILAAAEYAGRSGSELMTALAVAYQVQCRLSDVAPVRDKGFDHTTQGSYSVAAGVSKILGLDQTQTAHAIAIAGTAFNALRVSRTGQLSHWKGLAFPNAAAGCVRVTFLAKDGITGPLEVFEGDKGFVDAIAGVFHIDWLQEDLDRVTRTVLKSFSAEIHSQTTIQAVLDLKARHPFRAADIERIEVDTFEEAFHIIGGGEQGDKTASVMTKEQADHSLPYLVAVAILDGEVTPAQFQPERIQREDVQSLLRRVAVIPISAYSRRFPAEMPSQIRIVLRGGSILTEERRDYPGFVTRPMTWEAACDKFERLASRYTTAVRRRAIMQAVAELESIRVRDLMRRLASARVPEKKRGNA